MNQWSVMATKGENRGRGSSVPSGSSTLGMYDWFSGSQTRSLALTFLLLTKGLKVLELTTAAAIDAARLSSTGTELMAIRSVSISALWKHLAATHCSCGVHVSGWKRLTMHMTKSIMKKRNGM